MAIIKERAKKEWREFNIHAPAGIGQVTDMFERSTINKDMTCKITCMGSQATLQLEH
jgi:hypothetical protein